ncbi:hypothetical protein ABZW30_30900 [Kitasatospora sp. NPDC004669]|uniref:hypothetical protein n=1 Tax=Kitasatospora sp. NPDC004669 TaxID=3154555 RepID=UPI0033B87580
MPVRLRRAVALAAVASLSLFPAAAHSAEPVAYTLRNARAGTCLHHTFGTAQVRLEPCEAVPEQRWELRPEGASLNVSAFDPEKGGRGCVAIGDGWNVRYGQCRTTEAAWDLAPGSHVRVRSESELNDNDLYLTQTRAGNLGAQPGGDCLAADWVVTEAP